MDLTFSQLQRVNELQVALFNLKNFITGIKQLMSQLANDNCRVDIAFNLHNQDRHEKNEAIKKSNPQDLQDWVINGPRTTVEGTSPCQQNFIFSFEDTDAMRLLALVITQKEQKAQQVQKEIESILIRTMRIEITEIPANPIQHLHTK